MISVKIHERGGDVVLAACDSNLLGKKFSAGELRLEVSSSFYAEREIEPDELLELLENCTTANLVGEKVIDIYCEKNPEHKDAVIEIDGVPHLQVFAI